MEKLGSTYVINSSPISYQKKLNMVKKPNISLDRTDLKEKEIVIKGRFKSCSLYNETLHIIVYPKDGLGNAVDLQEIEEWTNITLNLKKNT